MKAIWLLTAAAAFISTPSINAKAVELDITDYGIISDIGIDGVGDSIDKIFNFGRVAVGAGDQGRLNFNNRPLSGNNSENRAALFVYDLSGFADPIVSATLNFVRFVPASPNFNTLSGLTLSSYASPDDLIGLDEFERPTTFIQSFDAPTTTGTAFVENLSADVTNFITGDFIGFRIEVSRRGGANILNPNGVSETDGPTAAFFDAGNYPVLDLNNGSVGAVPIPASIGLLLASLAALGVIFRGNRKTA